MTFDLQAAREIAIKLTLRYPAKELIDVDYQNALAGEMLPGACDEIARLDREVSVARNLASLAKGIVDEQAIRIEQLEDWLKEEKAQNLLNFQRHDEGEKRSWDDLSEKERAARIEFAGDCLMVEGKL